MAVRIVLKMYFEMPRSGGNSSRVMVDAPRVANHTCKFVYIQEAAEASRGPALVSVGRHCRLSSDTAVEEGSQ